MSLRTLAIAGILSVLLDVGTRVYFETHLARRVELFRQDVQVLLRGVQETWAYCEFLHGQMPVRPPLRPGPR